MSPRPESYYEVLTAAVKEFSETGYTSAERLAYWQARIEEAARRTMKPASELEAMLREAMAAIYKRLVDNGQAFTYRSGVPGFTSAMLKQKLRDEVSRRVLASADLIKLNREQAIAKTKQRLAGWASSIPPGGSDNIDRNAEKAKLRKALAQLPFEERRVVIDQGHKLSASIKETIALDGGAIAVKWRSHWRQPGYNYRKDHKERDERVYLLRSSWAREAGLVKPGSVGCYEDVTAFAEEPICRCYGVWIYSLRDLPDDMITAKGRAAQAEAARKVAAL